MKVAFELIPKEFVCDTVVYDYKDPMSDALSKVNKFGAVVVFKDGSYYGIVDDRSIAHNGTTKIPQNYPVGKFAKQVPTLSNNVDIKRAIEVFYNSSSKAVPFTEDAKIKGIVKRSDILKSILSLHLLSTYKASDVMSTPVIAIDQEESLDRAKYAMRENGVNRLAVLDRGKLFGILSYKDIISSDMQLKTRQPAFSPKGRMHPKVGEFAQRSIHTIDYGDSAEQAIRELIKNNISSLLVTRKGKPSGMLTVRDVLETIVKNSNVTRRNIVISGLNTYNKEYEDDITITLESFAQKADKFRDVKVDYIALNIKDIKGEKSRRCELKARVGLAHGGTVSMGACGFNIERTLKVLTSKLYKAIETKNDLVITGRKV